MSIDTKTCPKCGALIVPQLVRCRQCKTYLHGTSVEGWIFQNLLGGFMAGSPGTAILMFMIALYYVLQCVLAGPSSILAFSGFSLIQIGATHGPSILRGEYWRFVTSIFGHHDALHVALNMWCLATVGPLVEQIFDRKKMIGLYILAGVGSMVVSHVYYVLVLGGPNVAIISAGASGAVCGMIGAAWMGAKQSGPQGTEVAYAMKRWAILMVVWGLFVPGINNAAHFGGFVIGGAIAYLVPVGLTQTVNAQKVLSVVILGLLATVIACTGLMLWSLKGYPASLPAEDQSRGIFGFVIYDGVPFRESDRLHALQKCETFVQNKTVTDEALKTCELSARANHFAPLPYTHLARMYQYRGNGAEAARLYAIQRRLSAVED